MEKRKKKSKIVFQCLHEDPLGTKKMFLNNLVFPFPFQLNDVFLHISRQSLISRIYQYNDVTYINFRISWRLQKTIFFTKFKKHRLHQPFGNKNSVVWAKILFFANVRLMPHCAPPPSHYHRVKKVFGFNFQEMQQR